MAKSTQLASAHLKAISGHGIGVHARLYSEGYCTQEYNTLLISRLLCPILSHIIMTRLVRLQQPVAKA
jgi:hypothetical protein